MQIPYKKQRQCYQKWKKTVITSIVKNPQLSLEMVLYCETISHRYVRKSILGKKHQFP